MKNKFILMNMLLTAAAWGQLQTGSIQVDTIALNGTATLSGMVDGIPPGKLDTVRITTIRISPASPLAIAAINAAKDGTFNLTQLPPGTYNVCVHSTDGDYVDPCSWGLAPPTVTVVGSQQLKGLKYSLVPGVRVKARIDDPAGHLQKKATDLWSQHVLVGVISTKGNLFPMGVTKSTPAGVDHEMVVPIAAAVKLAIFSKGVDLEDDKKQAVPAGGLLMDITQASAQAKAPTFNFIVKGRKAL